MFAKIYKHRKLIFLLITIVVGMTVLWPYHNFQQYLSQGDHGRDLYCSKKVLDGALPYRDFSWLYGPLMPYYYGMCYLIGGISIQSVLVGQIILTLLIGVFVYLTCVSFLSALLSFVCAFWYWSYRGTEFFYTYNHSGGILAIIIALYCVIQYIKNGRRPYVFISFVSMFFLMLIRLNMGVFMLIALTGSLILIDTLQKNKTAGFRRRSYVFLALGALFAAALIYALLLYGLPDYAIYQSFPYGKAQRTDTAASIGQALGFAWYLFSTYFSATAPQKILGILILICTAQVAFFTFSKKSSPDLRKRLILILVTLFSFLAFAAHEYIASGVYYRVFWFYPIMFVILFYLFGLALMKSRSRWIVPLVSLTLFLPAFWNMQNLHQSINHSKNPMHLLNIGPNKIYTFQTPFWFQPIYQGTEYLKKHTRPDEKVLVIPFDALYLFLSERDSASRQLVFFEHIHVTEEQQRKLIENMESDRTNWVVKSNRSRSIERGMGNFGETHCKILGEYLDEHFETVATYGDWVNPGGWGWQHGVKILKRK